jgi:agmatinase
MNKASKAEKIKDFDASGVSTIESLFGLPFTVEESEIIVIPVPWEVTVSYAAGTACGPDAILKASAQVDLYDPFFEDAWKLGFTMIDIPQEIHQKSEKYRKIAAAYIDRLTSGELKESDTEAQEITSEVNQAAIEMNQWVENTCTHYINNGKVVLLLGGDHSTPLGFMKAVSKKYEYFGILQIDAHSDLRIAYEGFRYSHASITYNAVNEITNLQKVVQIGIRDYSEGEAEMAKSSAGKIKIFYDREIKKRLYDGETWALICKQIIEELPENIYVTFDIDGLDPKLCPNTGTPVAGGFETDQVLYLLEKLVESGKKIIGFDLNEVAPGEDEWDANVGARLLYRIGNMVAKSQGRAGK